MPNRLFRFARCAALAAMLGLVVLPDPADAAGLLAGQARGAQMLGQSADTVAAALGRSAEQVALPGGGQRWFYPTTPYGQVTWAADFDGASRLVAFRQVLNENAFFEAVPGRWNEREVRERFGPPLVIVPMPRLGTHVWTYRYRDPGSRAKLMHFAFGDDGILRGTQSEIDTEFEPTVGP